MLNYLKTNIINIIFYSVFSFIFIYLIFLNLITYDVEKITLQKGNQIIVLQGMLHVAPESFYNKVIHEKSIYKKNDYLTFYELIKSKEINQEKYIKYSIKKIIKRLDWKNENSFEEIQDGFNLDISMTEFNNLAKIYGLTNKLTSFEQSLKNQGLTQEKEGFIDTINIPKPIYKMYLKHNWIVVNQLVNKGEFYNDIIIQYRNQKVVNHLVNIEENAYITYGQSHLKGIVHLLVNKGFVVKNKEKINLF